MKKNILFIVIVIISFSFLNINAEENAREIIKNWDQQLSSPDEKANIEMLLYDKSGGKRRREVQRNMKTSDDGKRKILIKFTQPTEVKNTKLLTIEKEGVNDIQFFYLPALRKIRRMSANNDKDRFVGSDITFGDLKVEQLDLYRYSLVKEEKINGTPCYVIQAEPKETKTIKNTGYGKRILWIAKEKLIDIKREFYDKQNKLIKTYINEDIVKLESGDTVKYRAGIIKVEDFKEKHRTELIFSGMVLNSGLDDSLFTKRYLLR